MTDKERKAVERCSELIKVEHANWIGTSNQKAIETVLDMLEEYKVACACGKENSNTLRETIKILQKEISIWEKYCTEDLEKQINELNNKNFELEQGSYEKDKIIDKMARYIEKFDTDESICMMNIVNAQMCNEDYTSCKDCIKQYFKNLAEKRD